MKKTGRIIAFAAILTLAITCMTSLTDRSFAASTQFEPVQPEVDRSYKGKNAARIPVITYHKMVSDREKRLKGNKNDSLVIAKSKFDQQMKYLHVNKWRTLSMEEFYLWHRGKLGVPRKSILITFDDGNYSVIKYGLPTLKKYDMRATLFMIGIGNGPRTYTKPNRKGRYNPLGLDMMKQISQTYPNFEFQSHTWNMHRMIKGKPAAKAMTLTRQTNDMKIQQRKFNYTFLAYPFGAYTQKTIKSAKANGIKMAFTYGKNAYATRKQSVYAIKRIKIPAGASMRYFKRWVKR